MANRYERETPGELVHMGVIPDCGGWRAHASSEYVRGRGRGCGIGFDCVHAVIDDHTRLA